ncbi:MAG: NAD(P)H-hydrate dehydratase [Actinobacteria bacterium]|nr:MAG: NAD(P)H-hydrate dehydratase [Actinomycetota bacterium]
MKPVLTPAEAAILDRETQARGIDAASLMERAGRQVARAATAVAGGFSGRRAVVVCGKGNNGGDGLVAARHLRRWGIRTTVVMMQPPEAFGEPAATNFLRLGQTDVRVRPFSPDTLARELARSDVAVDAMFGTGFRGSPEGDWERAIAGLNDWGGPVVAVDIPSGVNGETGAVKGVAVTADVTVTFGAAKIGIVLLPGALHAGLVEVVDIGFPADLLRADVWLSEGEDVAAVLPVRPPDTHKRDAGVVVVIGGSRSMTGAVSLMGEAAYRAGAGLVSVAVPEGILPVVQAALRETTFIPLPATDAGTVAGRIDRLDEVVRSADAVAIGPGMTTDEETAAFIRSFVRACPVPIVVDADGLNAFAGRTGELADRHSDAVLTPHAGEFARLAGITAAEVGADRVGHARKLASDIQATVLLKGSRTVIASPEGRVRINPTGGPSLATGGTGDVLTGMIAGLIARGLAPIDAATAGAYLHGIAGSHAGREKGEGATAGDVLAHVPDAVAEVLGR